MEARSRRPGPTIVLCTLALVLSFVLYRGGGFPVVLGGAAGLLIFGGIPALIHWGMARLKSSEQRGRGPWYTWGAGVIIVFGLTFLGEAIEPSGTSQRDVRFAPDGFSFSVVFSAEPEVTTLPMPQADGSSADGVRAEVIHDSGVFERAEFMPLDRVVVTQLTRESILADAEAYARMEGLSNLEFSYEQVDYGHVGGVRGYRTLFHEGQPRVDAVYEMQAHFGPADLLMLYTGGPVGVYPTTETVAFRSSVTWEFLDPPTNPLTGEFFYPTNQECNSFLVRSTGLVSTPLCGSRSEMECDMTDNEYGNPVHACTFVCAPRLGRDTTIVFQGRVRDLTIRQVEPEGAPGSGSERLQEFRRLIALRGVPDVMSLYSAVDSTLILGLYSSRSLCERARLRTP